MNFKKESEFYEEYLKPRSTRGIYDYLTLGLLPPLDIYREDLIPGDLNRNKLKSVDLDGVLISHAHMDHAGYVGLLGKDIPVFSSAMTAAILKASQDARRTKISGEVAYTKAREKTGDRGCALKTKPYRKSPSSGRDFFLPTHPPKGLLNFWENTPSGRDHESGKLAKGSESDKPTPFESFEVSHSIFGATAYCVETENGWIAYTGDLRFHGKNGTKTEEFVGKASKLSPKILITEGTRTEREEIGSETEKTVYENCLAEAKEENGLVIADFSSRNFERLETFSKIAKETDREPVVTAKDAYILDSLKYVDGTDRISDVKIYKGLTVWKRRNRWEKQILEKFDEKAVEPHEIAGNPGSYVLCFSFWDINNLMDIKPEGGKYIYSTSEAFSEEQKLDIERLWKWLQFFDLEAVGFDVRKEDGETRLDFESGYHCSGHASPEELLEMVEKIDPETVIPVHTENPEFFKKNLRDRDVKIPQIGDSIEIE